MTNVILTDEVESRVAQEALRRGIDPQTLAMELIEKGLIRDTAYPSSKNAATAKLLENWMIDDAAASPAELESQRIEGEEFMRNLDKNRRDSDGVNARSLWP